MEGFFDGRCLGLARADLPLLFDQICDLVVEQALGPMVKRGLVVGTRLAEEGFTYQPRVPQGMEEINDLDTVP